MKTKLFNSLFAAWLIASTPQVFATPITYQFTLGGFDGGGTVTGSFTGQDLNGDGYLSSFVFSQNIDFNSNQFEAGLNEITYASATFSGSLDADEFGSDGDNIDVSTFTIEHDLTLNGNFFGIPWDLFFVLNFKLNNGGVLGDDPLEGILLAPFDQSYVFGLGPFLPAPEDPFVSVFYDQIPAGMTLFDLTNELDGGATLTSGILLNQSSGTPCLSGSACGVVHSVFLDSSGDSNLGGFDTSNEFISVSQVSQVSEPATIPLLSAALAALVIIRLRKAAFA